MPSPQQTARITRPNTPTAALPSDWNSRRHITHPCSVTKVECSFQVAVYTSSTLHLNFLSEKRAPKRFSSGPLEKS
ncbi:hypothetical protein VTK26DRAFT_4557 [Humicola hyalothermophila]